MSELVDDITLGTLSVVANNAMNRTRDLAAYRRALRIDPVAELGPAGWLDLCCGSGRALVEAARPGRRLVGVDLVDFFAPRPPEVEFHVAGLADWAPEAPFDLITCVHGLHYIGDKLGVLARIAQWLTPDGVFVADFDAAGVRGPDGRSLGRHLTSALLAAGFTYDAGTKRISRRGYAEVEFPFTYLGADPDAGRNYTGQEAVAAHYAING
ncbi:class I SAM-dependent methyltransferase [Actinokineospora sp. NBRC 105648]|uniref:class I SAM-dependent methyltransferase n=1 Tax=Actinokineospora sp. NBRC 105648 TaxID=3032206 RepID=UPI0024A0EB6E|nr:class I SAM-dependent methyltransferase [Actinokineospora sp. NBRC 105648]GLZ40832.1 methyltransferase [Actinokineospora sp. NBRC 105648]